MKTHWPILLCLLVPTTLACGCRQTTGTTGTGPITPIGPLAPVGLAPVGTPVTGTAPSGMGVIGGSTRVTPPPNNAYITQTGGANFIPYGQSSTNPFPGYGGMGGGSLGIQDAYSARDAFSSKNDLLAQRNHDPQNSPVPNSNVVSPIGSGVATTGWTETNTNIRSNGYVQPAAGFPNTQVNNVRSADTSFNTVSQLPIMGMQAHDLTGQQVPLHPSQVNQPNQPATSQPFTGASPVPLGPNITRGYYPPAVDLRSPGYNHREVTPQTPNDPSFIGSARFNTPMADAPVSQGTTASASQGGPSTEPMVRAATDSSLPWRRPLR